MTTRIIDATKLSSPDFSIALMASTDGTVLVYHRGDLVKARRRKQAVNDLAKEAYDLYEKGWACLVQRRIRGHDGQFEYLAIKREHIDQ